MKTHHVLLLVIFILLGIIGAMVIKGPAMISAAAPATTPASAIDMSAYYASSTDMTNPSMAGMMLKTFPLDSIDSSTTVPTVSFNISKDPNDGWNLHIITTNFTFTPQNVNLAPVANEGHAHLYVDGNLIVVYGPWFHIDDLSAGTHTITVSLAANDHSLFTYNGAKIQATQQVTQ